MKKYREVTISWYEKHMSRRWMLDCPKQHVNQQRTITRVFATCKMQRLMWSRLDQTPIFAFKDSSGHIFFPLLSYMNHVVPSLFGLAQSLCKWIFHVKHHPCGCWEEISALVFPLYFHDRTHLFTHKKQIDSSILFICSGTPMNINRQ